MSTNLFKKVSTNTRHLTENNDDYTIIKNFIFFKNLLIFSRIQKELMKQNEIEVSAMLSCITNIVSADMAPLLIDEAIKLLKCSKPILRKKAMALVSKIFTIAP